MLYLSSIFFVLFSILKMHCEEFQYNKILHPIDFKTNKSDSTIELRNLIANEIIDSDKKRRSIL